MTQNQQFDSLEEFEAWATRHGVINLERAGDDMKTDNGWHFATYRQHATEVAWRAWANKPAIAAEQPIQEPVATILVSANRVVDAIRDGRSCALSDGFHSVYASPQSADEAGALEALEELNCAEEVLDSLAAGLDMPETSFDCIGDYITAVVDAIRKQPIREALSVKVFCEEAKARYTNRASAQAFAEGALFAEMMATGIINKP